MAEQRHPVLVIGLDGACFDLLAPWLENDELPCLSRLYHQGVRGTLESVIPPLSPEAWATFMTGKHPGQHGVMNFFHPSPGSYGIQFNSGAEMRAPTLWRLLSRSGRRVGVVGVPMTYPPEPVNGYLVAGLETPGVRSQFTYPPELQRELQREVGGYDLHGDFVGRTSPEVYLERLLAQVDNQTRAICYLLARYPADLSMVVIGATDRAQHSFWKFSDPRHPGYDPKAPEPLAQALRRIYERVDSALKAIIEQVPDPKTVLIMSDHGFGPCCKAIHLNRWLEARGYLARRPSSTRVSHGLARGAWRKLQKYSPLWLKSWLKSKFPFLRRQVESFFLFGQMDWARTRAFSLNNEHGYVYLHRRDRFPQGVVAPGPETEALCEALSADLRKLSDPGTGEAVVDRIYRVSALYPGPESGNLPDLIITWRGGYHARPDTRQEPASKAGVLIEPETAVGDMRHLISIEQSGSHRPEGILLAHGPALAMPGTIEGARLIDLAPTLLYLLGEPVPEDMGGQVLEDLFPVGYLSANPIRYCEPDGTSRESPPQSPYSKEEAEQVSKHLRDLGYLD